MHDDPVNVHGTHLKVSEIVSPNTLKLKFMHHQTYGFNVFIPGDTVAYVHSAELQIFAQGIVKTAKLISEREMLVELEKPFPAELKVGDALENVTWTPAVKITNCRFEGTISRGTLITTRREVLIENNVYYRTGMHAILIENDAMGWYESGPVADVTIRNNQFIECGFNSGADNYAIKINPENSEWVKNYYVHRNIRIENNTFRQYDYPVLSAKSTKGLSFIYNRIEKSDFMPAGKTHPAFNFLACTGVQIKGNQFGNEKPAIQLKDMIKGDIKSDIPFEILVKPESSKHDN